MDKILMKTDLSVLDGNHRLSAYIEMCPDIREFHLDVNIFQEGKRPKPGILYFDKKLNRLALKDAEPATKIDTPSLTELMRKKDGQEEEKA